MLLHDLEVLDILSQLMTLVYLVLLHLFLLLPRVQLRLDDDVIEDEGLDVFGQAGRSFTHGLGLHHDEHPTVAEVRRDFLDLDLFE